VNDSVREAYEGVRVGRRGFLALIGGSGALATLARVAPASLGGGALAACGSDDGPLFAPAEREVLTQVVERMVATAAGVPPVRESGALARIETLLRALDPELVRPVPALLRLVDWGPWLFDATPARFGALSDAAKDASLRGWQRSRLALRRQGFAALRNLAFFGWYAEESSWGAIGYAGPLLRPGEIP
jgi:hypothetical protein